jgi:GT2 family glycosyltransferase
LRATVNDARLGIVVATRNRAGALAATLPRLLGLAEQPRVVVVDNGSSDATVAVAREAGAEVIALGRNLGAGARTVGARRLATRYVAFSDDDSWWAPGALARSADLLDAHPRLGLVAARVLVGPDEREDPVCGAMAATPLAPPAGLPGRPVLGFVACGAVVRRSAFLAVGGFDGRYGIGGEEELLALDLAAAGWALAYVPEVVAHHHPFPARDRAGRRRRQLRNRLWSAWLRRPPAGAGPLTVRALREAVSDPAARGGALDALRGLPWVLRERRPVPAHVERAARLLERPPARRARPGRRRG